MSLLFEQGIVTVIFFDRQKFIILTPPRKKHSSIHAVYKGTKGISTVMLVKDYFGGGYATITLVLTLYGCILSSKVICVFFVYSWRKCVFFLG